jgi:hypothetical protein
MRTQDKVWIWAMMLVLPVFVVTGNLPGGQVLAPAALTALFLGAGFRAVHHTGQRHRSIDDRHGTGRRSDDPGVIEPTAVVRLGSGDTQEFTPILDDEQIAEQEVTRQRQRRNRQAKKVFFTVGAGLYALGKLSEHQEKRGRATQPDMRAWFYPQMQPPAQPSPTQTVPDGDWMRRRDLMEVQGYGKARFSEVGRERFRDGPL